MRDSTDDTHVEDENPNPKRAKGNAPRWLVISIGLFLLVLVGIYAIAEHQRAESLAGQLKSVAVEQQTKPRPFLPEAEREAIRRSLAAIDAGVPAPVVAAIDAGSPDVMPPPAKKVEKAEPSPSKPASRKQVLAPGAKAVKIHILMTDTVDDEVRETARALKKCGDAGTDLILVVKKVDNRDRWPVLVEADPPMTEETVTKYAICLQNRFGNNGGKVNQVEIVSTADFESGFTEVARVTRPVDRK